MIDKLFTNRFEVILNPAKNEIILAQEQALERIRQVLHKAESEVARDSQRMSPEQRLKTAETELEKAEEHLLSALKSVFKAFCYIAPLASPLVPSFLSIEPIKELKGVVEIKDEPAEQKRDVFGWLKK